MNVMIEMAVVHYSLDSIEWVFGRNSFEKLFNWKLHNQFRRMYRRHCAQSIKSIILLWSSGMLATAGENRVIALQISVMAHRLGPYWVTQSIIKFMLRRIIVFFEFHSCEFVPIFYLTVSHPDYIADDVIVVFVWFDNLFIVFANKKSDC